MGEIRDDKSNHLKMFFVYFCVSLGVLSVLAFGKSKAAVENHGEIKPPSPLKTSSLTCKDDNCRYYKRWSEFYKEQWDNCIKANESEMQKTDACLDTLYKKTGQEILPAKDSCGGA